MMMMMVVHSRRRGHNDALMKFYLKFFFRFLREDNNFLVLNLLLVSLDQIRLLSLTLGGHLLAEKVTFLGHAWIAAFVLLYLLLISQHLLPQFDHFVPVLSIGEHSECGDSLHIDQEVSRIASLLYWRKLRSTMHKALSQSLLTSLVNRLQNLLAGLECLARAILNCIFLLIKWYWVHHVGILVVAWLIRWRM